jgi:hypothetical protein
MTDNPDMPDIAITSDGRDIYVMADGVKIARRGHPGTPEAGTWVSLKPGWTVTSNENLTEMRIEQTRYLGTVH